MKSFNEFVTAQREDAQLQLAASLIVESKFPIFDFAEWYLEEGIHYTPEEMGVFLEFWGDTWKSAAKGAAVGGAVGSFGGGIGAGLGALAGGAMGGLYGAGKGLYNKWMNRNASDVDITKKQAYDVLTKLKDQSGKNPDPAAAGNFGSVLDQMLGALRPAPAAATDVSLTAPAAPAAPAAPTMSNADRWQKDQAEYQKKYPWLPQNNFSAHYVPEGPPLAG